MPPNIFFPFYIWHPPDTTLNSDFRLSIADQFIFCNKQSPLNNSEHSSNMTKPYLRSELHGNRNRWKKNVEIKELKLLCHDWVTMSSLGSDRFVH